MPPEESDLSHQNIKDRFHGSNDPVAKRILSRAEKTQSRAPEDKTVTSIYISGVDKSITETDLRFLPILPALDSFPSSLSLFTPSLLLSNDIFTLFFFPGITFMPTERLNQFQ